MPRLSKSRCASRLAAQSRIRDHGSGQFLSNNANDPRPVDQENAEILDFDDSNIMYINDEEEDAMYQWSCKHSAVVTDTADDVGVDTVGIVDTLPSSANIDSEQQSTDTVDIQPREAMQEEATLDVPDGAKFLFGADYLSNAPKRSAIVLLWTRAVSDAKRFCTNERDCGTSRWSKNRLEKKRSQLRAAGAANGNRITTFFPVLPVPIEPAVNGIIDLIEHEANEAFEGVIDLEEVAAYEEENVLEKIFVLANNEAKIVRNKRHCKSSNSLATWYTLVSLAILRYLEIYMECGRRMNASIQVANVIFGKSSSKDIYRAACIRFWAKSFLLTGLLPNFRQGKHAKIVSVISREDIRQTFRQLLRNMSDKDRSPETFQKLLNTDILMTIPGAPPSISLDTARRWMHIVGFRPCKLRKHYYTDGHNREDVLAYRTTFLETFEKRFTMYEGENMETVVPPTEENLAGDKEVIFITHDETTFYANDCNTSMWMEGAKQKIRPKSVGTSLMVSGFVCPCHGFIRGQMGDEQVTSYKLFEAGVNRDGWFTNDDLIEQLQSAVIPLAKSLHPNKTLLFAFDNSMSHHKKAPDGLDASILTLSDKGKNLRIFRDTRWTDVNGVEHIQTFRTHQIGQKGLRTILTERGLFRQHMLRQCPPCKKQSSARAKSRSEVWTRRGALATKSTMLRSVYTVATTRLCSSARMAG